MERATLLAGALIAVRVSVAAVPAQAATALMVTNCGSSGSGSLAAEIAKADGASGDVIKFALKCSTIKLSSTLAITSDLTVDGPGPHALAVSGAGKHEVFSVGSSVSASISGLTIEDGSAVAGSNGSKGANGKGVNGVNGFTAGPGGNGAGGEPGGDGGGIYNAGHRGKDRHDAIPRGPSYPLGGTSI